MACPGLVAVGGWRALEVVALYAAGYVGYAGVEPLRRLDLTVDAVEALGVVEMWQEFVSGARTK